MKQHFKHKVVVVTGANGAIGRALSLCFAKGGARIVLIDLDGEQLQALQHQVERLGTEALSMACDITDPDQVKQSFDAINLQFGGIDILINNAGVTHISQFVETELEVFRKVMDVNFFGAINCTQAALNSLIERKGMIITLSSMAGFSPKVGSSGYSASKHALHGLFESMRAELIDTGVHVMMVCPGQTESDIRKNALAGDGTVVSRPTSPSHLSSPGDVAQAIYDGAVKKKRLIVHSSMSKRGWFVSTFFPDLFERENYRKFMKSRSN